MNTTTERQTQINQLLQNPEPDPKALAEAYRKLGNEYRETGDLQPAVTAYEQAIEYAKQLSLETDENRNELAHTYVGLSRILINLGTSANLQKALTLTKQAIDLIEELPKNLDKYQNDLATAYRRHGDAQANLGGTDNLKAAIKSYNQAIRIGETLPKDNPTFQNDLAKTYGNQGNAQQTIGDSDNLTAAIESYHQALMLMEKFDQQSWQFIEVRAKLLGNLSLVYLELSEWDKANDIAEQGLDLLRELEINGTDVLRELREELFEFTIDTYLSSAYHFLPEFLLEHLDPENVGAAPQSEAMHEAALWGLQELYMIAYQQHPELMSEIIDTLMQLAKIRELYFVGTANEAKLSAQYFEENANDRQQAEYILIDYIQRCPTDIEGYLNLAAFYQRQQQIDSAVQAYETALQTFANTLPKRPDEKILQQTINTALGCVDLAAEIQFGQAFLEPAVSEAARLQMNQHYNKAQLWLEVLLFRLPDFLHNVVKTQIEKNLVPRFEQIQNDWLQQRDQQKFEQWLEQEQARHKQKQQLLLQAVRLLPKNERQFIEAILSLSTIMKKYLEKWQAAETEEAKANIEAQISEILTRRMQEFIEQLHENAFSEARDKVESALSDVWAALDSADRKWLATAWHCLAEPELQTFAGLNFGIAIEKNLLQRWFYPVREQAQEQGIQFTLEDEEDFYQTQLVEFLNHPNKHLTLGVLVTFLNQLAHSGKGPCCKAEQSLFDYLSQQPNKGQLLDQPTQITKIRKKALYKILDIRNRVAHPKNPPNRPQLEQMLKDVVTDEKHAFFRYFVGIFMK